VVGVGAEADEARTLAPEGGEFGGYLDYVRGLPNLFYAAIRDPQARFSFVGVSMYRCTNIPVPLVMLLGVMLL
jgi:hypothetical protein